MTSATFSMTKLIVADLDASSRFYQAACGLIESRRISAEVGGRKFTEIVMESTASRAATFVLMAYDDTPTPATGETVLGFFTDDMAAFVDRIRAGGGTITQEPVRLEHLRLMVGFAVDPEGHVIELLQTVEGNDPRD
jgi:predicted enzyme related to lactoylglutathione lyase